ncbi:MIP/aquaporin family protein [Haloactinomyces albus]|uniref:MIP family channel proteins n=1 Tax=Haloactinomyces albus TaxID=1352928 RepID=A0AAE3Z8Z1_9ACTN|nr:MIP family channel protein [Haloactinomyces albus]MDR7300528.1 MIP family channel proteins [Haloactinomyces albus]
MAAAPDSPSTTTATTAAFCAELVGTFMLTFSGTATVLAVHELSPHEGFTVLDDIAISLAFAMGIVAAVYTVAAVSGAHINPAVTVALAVVRRFPWRQVPVYLAAQLAGAILAALVNRFLFAGQVSPQLILGSTSPGPQVAFTTALLAEFVITLVLMLVVMATAVFERAPGGASTAGLAIGLWVGAAVFLSLPISGGSLNPARTLGPDIVALQFPYWWIYIVGPTAGAIVGAALWTFVLGRGSKETVEHAG